MAVLVSLPALCSYLSQLTLCWLFLMSLDFKGWNSLRFSSPNTSFLISSSLRHILSSSWLQLPSMPQRFPNLYPSTRPIFLTLDLYIHMGISKTPHNQQVQNWTHVLPPNLVQGTGWGSRRPKTPTVLPQTNQHNFSLLQSPNAHEMKKIVPILLPFLGCCYHQKYLEKKALSI